MSGPVRFSFDQLLIGRWRNGGGSTREIISWPGADAGEPGAFGWRASIATIDSDGDFSAFPGVDRIITLLDGHGVILHGADGSSHALTQPGRPHPFAGEQPVHATLVAGPSLDFNIMTRRGEYSAEVRLIERQMRLPAGQCGVLYVMAGEWRLPELAPLMAGDGIWWHSGAGALFPGPAAPGGMALWANIIPCLPDGGA